MLFSQTEKADSPRLVKQLSIDDPLFDEPLPLSGIRSQSLSAFPREDEGSAFVPTKAFLKRDPASLSQVWTLQAVWAEIAGLLYSLKFFFCH